MIKTSGLLRKIILVILVGFVLLGGAGSVFAVGGFENSPDPLVRCLYEARRIAPDYEQYPIPDCANQYKDDSVVVLSEAFFKKKEAGMTMKFEWAKVEQYFRDWKDFSDLRAEHKRLGDAYYEANKIFAGTDSHHKVTLDRQSAGIGDYSVLITGKGWADVIHLGTGANDFEFTDGKDPIWIFDKGKIKLLIFTGFCRVELFGQMYSDIQNDYYSPGSDFWNAHHVERLEEGGYKIINNGETEQTFDAVLNPILDLAKKTVERIEGVCASKEVTGGVETKKKDGVVETGAVKGADPAKAINDWISDNFVEVDLERVEKEERDYELYGRTRQMTEEIINSAREEWRRSNEKMEFFSDKSLPERWRIMIGDQLETGAEIVSGRDYTAIFKKDGGSILFFSNSLGVMVVENVYDLNGGLVEVKTGQAPIDIQTINAYIKSKGTHYSVSYDPSKKETVVVVYEGEVEVSPKGGGKPQIVGPKKGGPGITVVRSKLSWLKAATFFGFLVVVGGIGIVLFRIKRGAKGRR